MSHDAPRFSPESTPDGASAPESTPDAAAPSSPSPSPLALPEFRRLLAMQACFGVAYSIFLILPKYLATHLGASTSLIAWIIASASLANVVTAPLIGRIRNGHDARRGIVIGNFAMAAGAVLFVFVDSPGAGAFVARILQGSGWAIVFSSAAWLAVAMAPRDRIAQAIGLHGSANILTNAIGPAFAEPAITHLGPTTVFLIATAMALFAAALATRMPLPTSPPPAAPAPGDRRGAPGIILFASFVLGVACGVMFTLHQPLALDRGLVRVRDFLIGYTIAAVTVRVSLPRLTGRFGTAATAVGSLTLYGLVVAAMPLLSGQAGLGLLGAVFGVAHGIFFPSFLALAISTGPESSRARIMSGTNALFNIGLAAVIPFGIVADRWGFGAAFVSAGIGTVVTAIALGRQIRVLAPSTRPG